MVIYFFYGVSQGENFPLLFINDIKRFDNQKYINPLRIISHNNTVPDAITQRKKTEITIASYPPPIYFISNI